MRDREGRVGEQPVAELIPTGELAAVTPGGAGGRGGVRVPVDGELLREVQEEGHGRERDPLQRPEGRADLIPRRSGDERRPHPVDRPHENRTRVVRVEPLPEVDEEIRRA